MAYEPLVDASTTQPDYGLLSRAYDDYRRDSAPCKFPGIDNQCAVRMSVALNRCGFGLQDFRNQQRIHKHRRQCQLEVEHVVGAQELADYLVQSLAVPYKFSGRRRSRHHAPDHGGGRLRIIPSRDPHDTTSAEGVDHLPSRGPRGATGLPPATARSTLHGVTGIIFFKNCFRRGGHHGPKTGDHIDLFDGKNYFNELIHASAGGSARAGSDLFREAQEVWFFPL